MIIVCIWVALVSVVTFALFGIDKRAAVVDSWRIPERTLLGLALIGGSPGALAGQRAFHHKTQKEPFRTLLYVIVGVQVVAAAAWLDNPNLLTGLFGSAG